MGNKEIKYIVNRLKIPQYMDFDWTIEVDGLEASPSMLSSLFTVTTPSGTYFIKKEWCKRVRVPRKVIAFEGGLN